MLLQHIGQTIQLLLPLLIDIHGMALWRRHPGPGEQQFTGFRAVKQAVQITAENLIILRQQALAAGCCGFAGSVIFAGSVALAQLASLPRSLSNSGWVHLSGIRDAPQWIS